MPPPGPIFLTRDALAFGATELAFLAVYIAAVLLTRSHATVPRLASVIALTALTYMLQQNFFQWCANPHWRGFVAASVPVQLMSASDIIFLTRVDAKAFAGNNKIVSKVFRAISLLMNQRRIGTPWQVKNIPATPPLTRTQFLRERLTTTLAAYIALDAMICGPSPPAFLITPQKQSLFPDINTLTQADIPFRVLGTIFYWISGFLLLIVVSNAVAVALAALHLSAPADRPPLFGAVGDAYTVRRFWGHVWHQCLRRGLTRHADFVADRVLRVPRGSLLSRYTRILAAFLISGAIHHVCVRGMGVPRAEAGGLVFFPLQALGILVEDAVQAAGRKAGVLSGSAGVRRAVGYVWVVVFLAWSTPTWFFPQARAGTDPELLLPVRVVRPLVGAVKGVVG